MTSNGTTLDSAAFQAYTELRKLARLYDLEDELEVPQLVVVGETSAGKSMLIQYFLHFPCSFTSIDIGTRCPVAYRLIHKSDLPPGKTNVIHPEGIHDPSQLAEHLKTVMERIGTTEPTGFSAVPYQVWIESADYTDFEILDVPGLVTGNPDPAVRTAVENIVEIYVRDPRFSIVLLKEATQLADNANGALRIQELCTAPQGRVTTLVPRLDYRNHMITIQTKSDLWMQSNRNGTTVNETIDKLRRKFGETYFVSMIFDGYSMTDHSHQDNVNYIAGLPELEREKVDQWIADLDRGANQPPNNFQKFNARDYRPLFGIDVVRRQIQQLWLKAFRAALPRLKSVLQRKLDDINEKYMNELNMYKHQDPEKIRDNYLEYLADFQQNVCRYAAYKSEIYNCFPTEVCGKTYNQIEDSCIGSWNRYKRLVWRAYHSADELAKIEDCNHLQLHAKLVGVRHFDRLNRIFHYLAFTYEPADISEDGILSATGLLYGGLDDYDNLQKAVREWVRKLISDTFVVGIAWLAQMYIYLLDMFRQNVKNYLLAPGKYSHLAKHTIFLNAVDREYHKTVRPWIRKAVRSVRDTCDSLSEYAHYDITARLKKLVFSIPTTIDHQLFNQAAKNIFIKTDEDGNTDGYRPATLTELFQSIPKHKIIDHICGSESYLTQDRNPQTLDHHENGRSVIMELYRAKCGYIIFNALSQFNSNVVRRIQEYGCMKAFRIPHENRSLGSVINRMTLIQIGNIANVDLDAIRVEIEKLEEQIGDLITALKLVENSTRAMSSPLSESNTNERERERQRAQEYAKAIDIGKAHVKNLRRRRGYIEQKTSRGRTTLERYHSISDENTPPMEINDGNESNDDEKELMEENDAMRAKLLMLSLYHRHDADDLAFGLESNESLRQDESDLSTLAHAYVDPDTLDYSAAAERAVANHN